MQPDVFAALGFPLPGQDIHVAVARLGPTGDLAAIEHKEPVASSHLRRPWETLSPPQQAGILCADKGFQKFVSERAGWACDEEDAASWLRITLGVDSRKELAGQPEAVKRLGEIRAEFLEWSGRVPGVSR